MSNVEKLKNMFPFLKDQKLLRSCIGYDDKTVFYNKNYFVYEKKHVDFDGNTHMNKETIKRQDFLKENTVLKILKDNYFKYIPKIYDFNENWVVFENINGPVFNLRHAKQSNLSLNDVKILNLQLIKPCLLLKWDDQIKEAINNLHNLNLCHTDLGLWNLMLDESTLTIKVIDLLSCVPLNSNFRDLDWLCYEKYIRPYLRK